MHKCRGWLGKFHHSSVQSLDRHLVSKWLHGGSTWFLKVGKRSLGNGLRFHKPWHSLLNSTDERRGHFHNDELGKHRFSYEKNLQCPSFHNERCWECECWNRKLNNKIVTDNKPNHRPNRWTMSILSSRYILEKQINLNFSSKMIVWNYFALHSANEIWLAEKRWTSTDCSICSACCGWTSSIGIGTWECRKQSPLRWT